MKKYIVDNYCDFNFAFLDFENDEIAIEFAKKHNATLYGFDENNLCIIVYDVNGKK